MIIKNKLEQFETFSNRSPMLVAFDYQTFLLSLSLESKNSHDIL